jgi:hypothetical protein
MFTITPRAFGLIALASLATIAPAADSVYLQRSAQQMKADHERRKAQMLREHEQKVREMKLQQDRLRKQAYDDLAKFRADARNPKQPYFNPAGAPPPDECFKAYVAAARSASSMEQLFPYLPVDETAALRQRQKNYDPKEAARGRAWHKKQDPSISEESLTFLSNPPYTNALDRHKRIAEKILDILSVKIDGNKATIVVSTTSGGRFNGEYFPYGKATVELTGEANYWRVSSYNDSNVIYKDPPQARSSPHEPSARRA